MINIIKNLIKMIKSFFEWRTESIKFNVYKDRKDKEKMRQRVKLRKQLRNLAKKGNIKDFMIILFLISFTGCKNIDIYTNEIYEGRYNNLELLKTNINNIKDENINIWVIKSETFEKMIDNIYKELELKM